jgi:hypothetical protein
MKKGLFSILLLLAALSAYGQSNNIVSLDEAIHNAAKQIQNGLNKSSTIIVYQFKSSNAKITDYVINELFNLLVNSRDFVVLDRTAQEVIKAELDFQFGTSAGMISDDSLASLTKRIGAQAIITGSLDDAATEYRFRIRVIGTETSAAIVSYAASVEKSDVRISAFVKQPRSVADKMGTGALNMVLGLGSYLERDFTGGLILTGRYALAAGLFTIEATALDWDSPMVGVPGTAGIVVAGLTVVYGFVRPFMFNRTPSVAAIMDNAQPRVVLTSDKNGGNSHFGLQLSYTVKF